MAVVDPAFLFVTCQIGAEAAVKHEIARDWPDMRFAYSRPGFITFRLPSDRRLAANFELRSVFARVYGFSLGKIQPTNVEDAASLVWQMAAGVNSQRLHVWARDLARPGWRGFTPGLIPQALETRQLLLASRPTAGDPACPDFSDDPAAQPGNFVLDCILLSDDQWWLGYHQASAIASCFPGGFMVQDATAAPISRAYLKMEEALTWSGLPLQADERCVEIGSSPGGASKSLLDRGLYVTGVDPALMDASILAHPRFRHIQKRGHEVRRREFAKARWLMADMNVAPDYTLDTVEAIVTHQATAFRGLILTIKLLEWHLAENLPHYMARVRSWGYDDVRARQLQHNRQEVCIAAHRSQATRRS